MTKIQKQSYANKFQNVIIISKHLLLKTSRDISCQTSRNGKYSEEIMNMLRLNNEAVS